MKKCRWLLSGEPCFLIAYDDENHATENVFLPELVSLRCAVLQGDQQSPFGTSENVAAKTGKIKVRIDYMHIQKLGQEKVNPFVQRAETACY